MKRLLSLGACLSFLLLLLSSGLRAENSDLQKGYEAFLLGDFTNALKWIGTSTSPGPLQDYAAWAVGKSQIETGNPSGGLATLQGLLQKEPNSLFADPARVQIGRAWQAQGENAKAKEFLEKILPTLPEGSKGEALYYLGLAKLALKETDAATEDFRQVYLHYPTSPVSDQALSQITQASGKAVTWSTADYLPRAEAYFAAKNYGKALEVYEQLGEPADASTRELVKIKKGECLYNLKRYGDAMPYLEAGPSVPADLGRQALLHLGMSQLKLGDEAGATATFERVQRQYPGTAEGEEALYRAGMIAHQAQRYSEASQVFARLDKEYPHGNFRDKALWAAAWAAYRRSAWEESLQWLNAMEQGAVDGATRGKALYWQARLQEKLGKKDAAPALFQKVAQVSPYSYYGFMALKQLKNESSLTDIPPVPAEWKAPPPVPNGPSSAKTASETSPWDLHFRKAEALADAGLGKLSQPELEAALKQNEGQNSGLAKLLEASRKTKAYFIPVLLSQKYWDRFKSLFSDSTAAEAYRSRLLYPYAYRSQIESAAARSELPAPLIVALMRQESGFMPWISSTSNAQGLMQLLPTTAAGRAKALGIPPGDLFDPDYNIQVGSAELKAMLSRFGDNWAYACAAYNAGPGRAKQWSEAFGNLPIDEFIEEIPFAETNLYVKLVLRNYWSYKTLYH